MAFTRSWVRCKRFNRACRIHVWRELKDTFLISLIAPLTSLFCHYTDWTRFCVYANPAVILLAELKRLPYLLHVFQAKWDSKWREFTVHIHYVFSVVRTYNAYTRTWRKKSVSERLSLSFRRRQSFYRGRLWVNLNTRKRVCVPKSERKKCHASYRAYRWKSAPSTLLRAVYW